MRTDRARSAMSLTLLAALAGTAQGREQGQGAPTPSTATAVAPDIRVRTLATLGPLEQEPVRIAAHPASGALYVLGGGGDVTRIDPDTGASRRVLTGADYLDRPKNQDTNIPLPVDAATVNAPITLRATLCLGLTFDREGRLHIVANVQVPGRVYVNRVDLYRTPPVVGNADPGRPTLWTRFAHPYGVGGFNHGACRIAQGPDGMIYLGSGSRTDHGEAGDDPRISKLGEAPTPDIPGGPNLPGGEYTACILRFDPAQGQQAPIVHSRGNRNPFGFDWDDQGRLFDVEHGPMADHPEELNLIEPGKHYGFPFVFGNGETPAYDDAPRAPAGLTFTPPLKNLGPAGLTGINPLYSLTPDRRQLFFPASDH